jgi:hypothetical protein
MLNNLLEMLQQAERAQSLQQQRADYAPQPSASPVDASGIPPGGLLGRWLALQADQQQPRSFGGDREQMPSAPANPNVRRLVRVSPAVQQQGAISASDGRVAVSDASLDPLRPGSQYAQAIGLCGLGPAGCAVGGGITAAQAILGGVAASLGGATVLNQKKPPVPGIRPTNTPISKGSREIDVVSPADQPNDGRALVGGDKQNPCLDRWIGEHDSCERFRRPNNRRFQDACEARAADRLWLCNRNGRTPDPEELAQYSWKDIARDRLWR